MNQDGDSRPEDRSGREHFTNTRWSLVLQAGAVASPSSVEALEQLCRAYWPPIYGFLRRRGQSPHDAQDITQGFFAALLRRNDFAQADQAKGRFRTYLLGALTHYLADERDRAGAQKRGGGIAPISLDETDAEGRYLAEPATDATPERAFDQRWATTLLEQAFSLLQEEFRAAGKVNVFTQLKVFLTQEAGPGGYDAVATQLRLQPGTVAVTVHRMRSRYRELLQVQVAKTVADPRDVEDEFRALFLGG